MVAQSVTTPTRSTWLRLRLVNPDIPGRNSALQPTPLLLTDRIRVFFGSRDETGSSSIYYVDLDRDAPGSILGVSDGPVVEPGEGFDRDGVVPSAVVQKYGETRLFYAGYRQHEDVRHRIYGGMAVSWNDGRSFTKYSRHPVMGPVYDETLFRVPHTVMFDENAPYGPVWQAWYGAGTHFVEGEYKSLPVYTTYYAESPDGIHWYRPGVVAIPLQAGEHRTARPSVLKTGYGYEMYFASGREDPVFKIQHATSRDGIHWTRTGDLVLPPSWWDNETQGYPAVIQDGDRRILFWNGNNYGREGFGVAVR